MKILIGSKDGGPESNVRMWGFESKHFGSVLLLSFAAGSREAFHAHAFNAVSWLLSGCLIEEVRTRTTSDGRVFLRYFENEYLPSLRPIKTPRDTMHKVHGFADRSLVLTFRGPWKTTWLDWPDSQRKPNLLTWGRKVVVDGEQD